MAQIHIIHAMSSIIVINCYNFFCLAALAGPGRLQPENTSDANKRHTMSHPPDHIPDMEPAKPAKEIRSKEDKNKEKVY